jgi:hypothetical protein
MVLGEGRLGEQLRGKSVRTPLWVRNGIQQRTQHGVDATAAHLVAVEQRLRYLSL